jgi:dTDP-glucose pyrophosphorylase
MKSSVIGLGTTVRELANMLEVCRVIFVQRHGLLVGSVTNGDFRRGIAAGASLDSSVERIMNPHPLAVRVEDGFKTRRDVIERLPEELRFLPVLNDKNQIVEIVSDKALIQLSNWAVLMAGGLGSRLKSLTSETPKPMLRIGEKPILLMIIEQLRRAGISRFVLSVGYKADVIENYFKDGGELDVEISYLREPERMGTAGCLSLLRAVPQEPFLVMNADVLADVDFHELLGQHSQSGCLATVCTWQHEYRIPYGVLQVVGGRVEGITEKPSLHHQIYAGICALAPQCVQFIPSHQAFEMPDLLQAIIRSGGTVATYPVKDFWIDIGSPEDFHRASHEFSAFAPRTA